MENKEFEEILIDVQKEYKRSNKLKDIIVIILIVLMFLQSAFNFGCFVWYESQFDYYDTAQETNTKMLMLKQAEITQMQNIMM